VALLSACLSPGGFSGSRAGTPPTVEITPVEASSPSTEAPPLAVAAEEARPAPREAVEPAPHTARASSQPAPLPGSTDKYAGSVGLGFASPSQGTVKSSCTLNGKQLWGKVQVVDAFPDIKVQVVDAFPDIKVQKVDAFADSCGKWQFVNAFPDIKVQFVTAFPDLKIRYVDAFPGNN